MKIFSKEHWNKKFTRKVVFLVYIAGIFMGSAIGYTLCKILG